MAYQLSEIIKEFCVQAGDTSLNRAARYYSFATRVLVELNLDLVAIPKSVQLFPNKEGFCPLPENYLNYVSISVVGLDGQLHGMTENPNIDLAKYYNKCGELVRYQPPQQGLAVNGIDGWGLFSSPTYIAKHYSSGQNTGAYFNAGGENTNGEYRIDKESKQIFFRNVRCQIKFIVMEYVTDIQLDDEDYFIHPYIEDSVLSGIYWRSIRQDRNFSLGEKQLALQTHEIAVKRAQGRFNTATYDEWISAIRKNNRASLKW